MISHHKQNPHSMHHPNFTEACEAVRITWIANDPTWNGSLKCGALYSEGSDPVPQINTTLSVCLAKWPGWEISIVIATQQWVGPLVGFLLPALVFVLTIPRNYRVPRGDGLFNQNIVVSALWLLFAFILLIVDVLIWIIAVFGLSGLIMVGAIDEAIKDWRILRAVEHGNMSRAEASYAITLTLIGTFYPRESNLLHHNDELINRVVEQICNTKDLKDAKEKLQQLLGHQASYGAAVGAPVVFYLGAYAYSMFDANSRLGDNDTAHAIAFGLWYGIIVLTATACSCVLGMTRPAIMESNLGRPPLRRHLSKFSHIFSPFESPYQTVWIWNRGRCVRHWTNTAWTDTSHTKFTAPIHQSITHILKSRANRFVACVLAIMVVSTVCGLAGSISYFTPIVGFGCRASTILGYACCQIFLICVWFYHNEDKKSWAKYPIYTLAAWCCGFAIFLAIGGTVMQLLGVFRNCICKAGLRYWWDHEGGVVGYATDTANHRYYAHFWIKIGAAGVSYIGFICVVGWGYFMRMKEKCSDQINALK